MKLRALCLSLLAVSAVAWAVRLGAQTPTPAAAPSVASNFRIVGVGGCAAAGCHNDQGPPGSPGSEYAAWAQDPHGRAYETVQGPKYKAILDRLAGTAYTEELCLKCHATPTADGTPLARDLLADGVGCESCHGPAESWRTTHYQAAWKSLTPDQKKGQGLFPTKDLTSRMQKCVECHVGTPEKDVNHDLIAAGHPRLTFEYASYHNLLPRHWREPHEQTPPAANARRDFEAHAWALGQAITAETTIRLLASRAARANQKTHPWPEFAEYGCYACHHALAPEAGTAESWRQKRGFAGRPGELPWGTWAQPAADALSRWAPDLAPSKDDPLAGVAALMRKPMPSPQEVDRAATDAAGRLAAWRAHLQSAGPWSAAGVREMLRSAVAHGLSQPAGRWPRDWDEAAQHYLAVAALYHALSDLDPSAATPVRRDAFAGLRQPLVFPDDPGRRLRFDSPVNFRPEKYVDALKRFQSQFGPGTAP